MDFDHESLLRCFLSEEEEQALIQWFKDRDHSRSDIFEYRLDKADRFREEGNELFAAGDFEGARQRYFGAIWQLDFDIGQQWNMMDKHQYDLNSRKLKVLSNICGSYVKAGDWPNAKRSADIGLRHMEKAELKDDSAKARFLYRKGLANIERGFSEDAYEALKEAERASPGDRQVRQLLKQAAAMQKEDRAKAKLVWMDKLLTEQEKACQGIWWRKPSVLLARLQLRWLRCCRRREKTQ